VSSKPMAATSPNESNSHHRMPMIQFRHGLREEIDVIINGISSAMTSNGQSEIEQMDPDAVPFWNLPAALRRKQWIDADIDAVNSGSATMIRSNFY